MQTLEALKPHDTQPRAENEVGSINSMLTGRVWQAVTKSGHGNT